MSHTSKYGMGPEPRNHLSLLFLFSSPFVTIIKTWSKPYLRIQTLPRVTYTLFSKERTREFKIKKLHIQKHQLYREYYLNHAKQKGGKLTAFHGARSQQGCELGSILRSLKEGANMLDKNALQTGV